MEKEYHTVATKISNESLLVLKSIAKKSGLTLYNMLQVIIESYLKYFSKETYISESLNKLLNGFADFRLAKDSFMFCSYPDISETNSFEIDGCITFIKKTSKIQPRCMLIRKGKNKENEDILLQSINDDAILNSFLYSFSPELIKHLRDIQHRYSLPSMTDALKFAVKEQTTPTRYEITTDINSIFDDNMRVDNGKQVDYEVIGFYKRHNGLDANVRFK